MSYFETHHTFFSGYRSIHVSLENILDNLILRYTRIYSVNHFDRPLLFPLFYFNALFSDYPAILNTTGQEGQAGSFPTMLPLPANALSNVVECQQ